MSYCAFCRRGVAPSTPACPSCGQDLASQPTPLPGYAPPLAEPNYAPPPAASAPPPQTFSWLRVAALLFLFLVILPALLYDFGTYLLSHSAPHQAARIATPAAPSSSSSASPPLPAPVVMTRPDPTPADPPGTQYRPFLSPPRSMPPGGYPMTAPRRPVIVYYRPEPEPTPGDSPNAATPPAWPTAPPAATTAPAPPAFPSPTPATDPGQSIPSQPVPSPPGGATP